MQPSHAGVMAAARRVLRSRVFPVRNPGSPDGDYRTNAHADALSLCRRRCALRARYGGLRDSGPVPDVDALFLTGGRPKKTGAPFARFSAAAF